MDTSETYIKMRLKAIPDLGMGCKPENDIMANAGRDLSLKSPLILRVETYKRISGDVWLDLKGDYYCDSDAGACQLECQDQLQAMLRIKGWMGQQVLLWNITSDDPANPMFISDNYWGGFNSWEQTWLACVMKCQYNKIWNGEEWVKS